MNQSHTKRKTHAKKPKNQNKTKKTQQTHFLINSASALMPTIF